VNFEWDEKKRQENICKHKIDFVDVTKVFNGPMLTRLDTRLEYGEDRWIGIGMADGRMVVVVYTENNYGQTIRLISARKALKHERKHYEKNISY
jgi:uncharacterized DUF497 family protein